MKPAPSRRDFLRLASLLPLSLVAPRTLGQLDATGRFQPAKKNVLVIVFDAFSAYDISLYGYPRKTTPNLDRLAQRAIIYHNHHAASNFTTPGTASLLTGTLPWTHRANRAQDTVDDYFVTRNIFSAFQDYHRIAYTHNSWADILLKQFQEDIEELIPLRSLFLKSYDSFIESVFQRDRDIASVSWTRNMDIATEGYSYSLFVSHIYEAIRKNNHADLKKFFPRGLPSTGGIGTEFLLETAIESLGNRLAHMPQPFLGYFHFLPPHDPYRTSIDFVDHFREDGFEPTEKPEDIYSDGIPRAALRNKRRQYDEFILYVDQQFGRLFDSLEASGLLENSWVVLTSDHGEMHERGITGHSTETLYQPVIRVPLMIFEPGRTTRQDVYSPTSAIDILPTLLHLTGHSAADWSEGAVLPNFAEAGASSLRNLYALRATRNDKYAPLTHASTAILKEGYKLMYCFGYNQNKGEEFSTLYDIESDPEELDDLSAFRPRMAANLLGELKQKLEEVNKPYS